MEKIITYDGIEYSFDETVSNKKILVNGKVVSEKKSIRSLVEFKFNYNGKSVEIKAIQNLNGYDFNVVIDGKIVRKAESQFKQLPNIMFFLGGIFAISSFRVIRQHSGESDFFNPIFITLFAVTISCIGLGVLFKIKQKSG